MPQAKRTEQRLSQEDSLRKELDQGSRPQQETTPDRPAARTLRQGEAAALHERAKTPEVHEWHAKIADYVEDQSWERPRASGVTRWPTYKSLTFVLGTSVGLWALLWGTTSILF
ncbi:MAG: hypothetical protein AAF530_22060 [Pseudomonadota bacterium]